MTKPIPPELAGLMNLRGNEPPENEINEVAEDLEEEERVSEEANSGSGGLSEAKTQKGESKSSDEENPKSLDEENPKACCES